MLGISRGHYEKACQTITFSGCCIGSVVKNMWEIHTDLLYITFLGFFGSSFPPRDKKGNCNFLSHSLLFFFLWSKRYCKYAIASYKVKIAKYKFGVVFFFLANMNSYLTIKTFFLLTIASLYLAILTLLCNCEFKIVNYIKYAIVSYKIRITI